MSTPAFNIELINALAELAYYKIEFEYTGSANEIKLSCPFHSDETPSFFLNIEKRVGICHAAGCEKSADIITLLAAKLSFSRAQITNELSQRYSLENDDEDNILDFRVVERFHTNLLTLRPSNLLAELYIRGITDEDIIEYRIGYDESTKRITIPIRNKEGSFVNIRKYLPGAPGSEKFRNIKDHGKIRLFPINQLDYSTILICGGELKAIVAAKLLNQHNIGAISATCGEDNWSKTLTDCFIGKDIIICFDIDEAGKQAARNRAQTLYRIAKSTKILTLPLDINKYPKGDINDYVGVEQKSDSDLFALLSSEYCIDFVSTQLSANKKLDNTENPTKCHIAQAISSSKVGKRISIDCVLHSVDTAPFIIPKSVFVSCDRSQKVCSICNIFKNRDDELYKLNPENASLLELVHSRKNQHRDALMNMLGIPKKCPIADFHTEEYANYEDSRISAQLELTDRSSDRFQQPALILSDDKEDGKKLELNESYEFIGRNWPHPNSQQSTLILSEYKQTTDALSNFQLSDEYKEKLKCFTPDQLTITGLQLKLDQIYADLQSNITKIYGRPEYHLVIDLTYHSPLFINFDGNEEKGWIESLIIGDSAQGKSQVAKALKQFYDLGEKVESKNSTVAGLLGGLQKTGDRWFVTWGMIPQQDKRLIILEELKGMPIEVFAKLTDMRSSGFAEIPKIEKRKTYARTRLIAISNPRSGRELSTYMYGIESIRELIGSIEDIRRFDIALILSNKDINQELINIPSSMRKQIPHIFTNDLCRQLILWAWTVKSAVFEPSAEKLIFDSANELSEKFHDSIPLVDKGSMKLKLARLSAALAARTFSYDADNNNYNIILVRDCHVQYIVNFLSSIYSTKTFGYSNYTQAIIESKKLNDETIIIHEFSDINEPKEFCKKLLHANSFDERDFMDIAGCDREKASNRISLLVRKNAIYRNNGRYYKNPEFIEKCRYWAINGTFDQVKPDYLKKKEKF